MKTHKQNLYLYFLFFLLIQSTSMFAAIQIGVLKNPTQPSEYDNKPDFTYKSALEPQNKEIPAIAAPTSISPAQRTLERLQARASLRKKEARKYGITLPSEAKLAKSQEQPVRPIQPERIIVQRSPKPPTLPTAPQFEPQKRAMPATTSPKARQKSPPIELVLLRLENRADYRQTEAQRHEIMLPSEKLYRLLQEESLQEEVIKPVRIKFTDDMISDEIQSNINDYNPNTELASTKPKQHKAKNKGSVIISYETPQSEVYKECEICEAHETQNDPIAKTLEELRSDASHRESQAKRYNTTLPSRNPLHRLSIKIKNAFSKITNNRLFRQRSAQVPQLLNDIFVQQHSLSHARIKTMIGELNQQTDAAIATA